MKSRFIAGLVAGAISLSVSASETNDAVQQAQDKLKATFNSLNVVDFKPTEIPGFFEVNMGNGTIYYHAEKELLFFGEIYNKNGENLTLKSRQEALSKIMDTLPMDKALVLGDQEGIPIIEFTDPDCPYCRNYEKFFNTIKDSYKVKRIIFFDNRIHPQASPKIEHILCSEDKELAYFQAYNNLLPSELKTCDEAPEIMATHVEIAKSLGVGGTPSFIMDGKMQTGFRQQPIIDYFNSSK